MTNVATVIEATYLGTFEHLASSLRQQYPDYKFNTYQGSSGTQTNYHGHDVGIECTLPDVRRDHPDNVALSVEVGHTTTNPKIMANVVWGHPSGHIEASFHDDWLNSDDWLMTSEVIFRELEEAMPHLIQVFLDAVARGYPGEVPSAQ